MAFVESCTENLYECLFKNLLVDDQFYSTKFLKDQENLIILLACPYLTICLRVMTKNGLPTGSRSVLSANGRDNLYERSFKNLLVYDQLNSTKRFKDEESLTILLACLYLTICLRVMIENGLLTGSRSLLSAKG